MKKLLALLGVTTLVTSASIAAVACTSTNQEVDSQNDNDIEFRELLNDYKLEITQRFNNNYNDNVNNFALFNGDSKLDNYKFLNLENLAEIGTNDEYVLNRTELFDFLNDINLLLNVNSLKSTINQLANEPEFNLLTNGLNNNIFDGFEIRNNQISLEVNNNEIYGLSVSLSFELILNFNYVKNGEIDKESLYLKDLVFTIINDEKIFEFIQNIINDLGKKLYVIEDSPLYFTDKKLQIEDEAFMEVLTDKGGNYISSSDFKDPLLSVINDIASISNIEERIEININKLNEPIFFWSQQYAKVSQYNTSIVNADSDLFKILTSPNEKDYSYEERIQIIEREYNSKLDDTYFRINLDNFLARYNLNQNKKINYDSILGYGNFDLSNITLFIGEIVYTVPTLNLVFDYSVEEFKREDYSSQILNSITAFQKVYQIEYSENSIFTIKNKYFWNLVDEKYDLGENFTQYGLNELTANYNRYLINELSIEIGEQAKFGPDGFNFFFDSSTGNWQNTNEGIISNANLNSDNRIHIQLGTFYIVINITGEELKLLNSGDWQYFGR